MGFSREEYWSGLPFSSPGHLLDPGIKDGLQGYKQILYHLSYKEVLKESIFEGFSGTSWSVQLLSHVRLFVTLWTAAHQAPQSMGFSRQEC